jgi:tetratricopeptide (TPR) repeat protein
MPLTPGDALFEYRVTRALGQGAFGTVYLAQDTLLDRPVAIKELTAAAQADRAAFQRFLQEARAAGSLNHPNIVTIHALKPADATVYLVMEYLPGGSLRALLSQRGRLPVDDAVRIAADVCDGLAAAHAKGIVHRDIKPENILLTADGRAKVGDFGIAHVPRTAGGAYVGGLTQTGFQPGTLIYMSPEQILGQAVDGRSDVYQVGALLYEMLAGRHYIDVEALTRRAQETAGGNVLRMQARLYDLLEEAICKHESPDVRHLRPDVPDWLGAIVAAALARPAAATPTAEGLAGELRNRKETLLDEAIHKGQIAPQTRPDEANAHFQLGLAYAQQGRADDAIREFQAALRINPDYAEAHFNLALVYMQQGRLDEAVRGYQTALGIAPDFALAHYSLGLVYWLQGRLDEAIREYQTALGIAPDFAFAHLDLGQVYDLLGQPDDAIREFQAALRLNPNNAEALYHLGLVYGRQGRLDEAIREFQAILRINPDYAKAHYSLGVVYAQQSRTDLAMRAFQAALRLNPDDAKAHRNLGVVYGQQGRPDEAIREFQATLRINPDYAEAHYDFGGAFRATEPHRRGDPGVPGGAADQPRLCRRALQPGCGLLATSPP